MLPNLCSSFLTTYPWYQMQTLKAGIRWLYEKGKKVELSWRIPSSRLHLDQDRTQRYATSTAVQKSFRSPIVLLFSPIHFQFRSYQVSLFFFNLSVLFLFLHFKQSALHSVFFVQHKVNSGYTNSRSDSKVVEPCSAQSSAAKTEWLQLLIFLVPCQLLERSQELASSCCDLPRFR